MIVCRRILLIKILSDQISDQSGVVSAVVCMSRTLGIKIDLRLSGDRDPYQDSFLLSGSILSL